MAVIEDLNLEASVKINGSTAPEFDDPPEAGEEGDGNYPIKRGKYIEVVDGAEFSVCAGLTGEYSWMNEQDAHGLVFSVFVDGDRVIGKVCEKRYTLQGKWTTEIKGHEKHGPYSTSQLRKFKFATLHKGYFPSFLSVKTFLTGH